MRTIVGHIMNPEIVDDEFTSLVEYIKYKLLEPDNQKLEAQWGKEHVKKMVDYIDRQMQDFDILHVVGKEMGLAPILPFVHFNSCILAYCSHFSMGT